LGQAQAAYREIGKEFANVPLTGDGTPPPRVRSGPAANAFCAKLIAVGGNCIVLRNPRN